MLTSILPGLRELRAPLAGGFLWLFWFWLVFGDAFSLDGDVSGPLERVTELEPLVSDVGRALVASVAAYVVGTIVLDAQDVVARKFAPVFDRGARWRKKRRRLPIKLRFSTAGGIAIQTFARRWLGTRRDRQPEPDKAGEPLAEFSEEEVMVGAQQKIGQDRDVVKTRLLDLSPSLHSEVDRPDAEATFRVALWPPLTALAVYLALWVSLWWAIALVLPLLLAWQGRGLRQEANDALATAFAARPELADVYGEQLPYRLPDSLREPPPNPTAPA